MPVSGSEPKVTPDLAVSHGLTREEYDRVVRLIGRDPTYPELGLFSALWSEHCSYKSSRVHLRRLPTKGPHVLQGPGENAGIVDIGGGFALAFKIESHNHPSFIEPFQGAATGVGGILRDIFTMGARPIALLDSLRFGPVDEPGTRFLLGGVVAGISHYGNCFGCPTVGGEVAFAPEYARNPLVNVLCLGLVPDGPDLPGAGRRGGEHVPLRRRQDGPRRHPRGDHGVGGLRRDLGRAAADRPGRRPVHGEAPPRGVPRGVPDRRGGGDPGHGRGRAGLLPLRDARAGGDGRRRGPRPRAPARAGDDALRDPAVGVPGADAARRRARPRGRGPAGLPEVGAGRGPHRARHGGRRAPRPHAGRGGGRGAGPGADRRGARSTTGRGRAPTGSTGSARSTSRALPEPADPGALLLRLLAAPTIASKREHLAAVRSHGRHQHPRPPGLRRGRPPDQGDAPRRRGGHRRQRPLRAARSLPGRGDGGGRGGAQRRVRRRAAAGGDELPELRLSRAPGDHVAVRGDGGRHRRRLRGARHPGHRGQRLLLQRDAGPGDPADARHRRRRAPRGRRAADDAVVQGGGGRRRSPRRPGRAARRQRVPPDRPRASRRRAGSPRPRPGARGAGRVSRGHRGRLRPVGPRLCRGRARRGARGVLRHRSAGRSGRRRSFPTGAAWTSCSSARRRPASSSRWRRETWSA